MSEVKVFKPAVGIESYMLGMMSTAHVSPTANAVFEQARELNIPFIQVLQYGWLVNFWTHDSTDPLTKWDTVLAANGVDPTTIANLEAMRALGYEVLMIDRDVSENPDLVDFYE